MSDEKIPSWSTNLGSMLTYARNTDLVLLYQRVCHVMSNRISCLDCFLDSNCDCGVRKLHSARESFLVRSGVVSAGQSGLQAVFCDAQSRSQPFLRQELMFPKNATVQDVIQAVIPTMKPLANGSKTYRCALIVCLLTSPSSEKIAALLIRTIVWRR